MGSLALRVVKGLVQKFTVFFIVVSLVFLIPRLAPGTPIDYLVENPRVPPEVRAELIRKFGLDRPIFPDQYVNFLYNFFVKLDLGYSFTYQEPVTKVILERLTWTLVLLGSAISISIPLGIFLGLFLAWKRGTRLGYAPILVVLFARSLPVFWIGMVLLLIFSYYLRVLPSGGAVTPGARYVDFLGYLWDVVRHLVLPLMTLSCVYVPRYVMLMRNSSLNVLGEYFILVAQAKGVPTKRILFNYIARNAILPILTMISIDVGFIIGGAVITETVFSYPGIGRLTYEAVVNRDYPLLLGVFTMVTGITLLGLTVAELLYSVVDPRVRTQ